MSSPRFRPYEEDIDGQSPNRNLAPVSAEVDAEHQLWVGGCRLADLAAHYGTPLYVLDETTLRASCRAYCHALTRHYPGESLVLYASKAHSSLAMAALMASEGLGLDVVSAGELLTALAGGVNPRNIVLHGNNKSRRELELALEHGVTVVLDNWLELDLLEHLQGRREHQVRLLIRFTPGIECHTHEYIRTGHLDSKFGFDLEELDAVLRRLAMAPWAEVAGLHAHIGSQIFELQPHGDLAGVMVKALGRARALGHHPRDLNVGGGLGVRYVAGDDPPAIAAWVQTVSAAVVDACHQHQQPLPRLLCEPGRSLVATAGLTLYQVGSRKEIPGVRTYVAVDGGMSDNPRPITYQSRYTACLPQRCRDAATETVTVAGKHCESGDVLLHNIPLPPVAGGDLLAVFATGAYNASMASNYNRIPRPAAVLVHKGQASLVQRRETDQDLLRWDILPEHLRQSGPVPINPDLSQ
ncbi:MAG: diaminopimelate decarboxylase [Synechococcus sp. SB0673_bin_10]|uniref:Diaminopimelate decarboxylase n=1 Tax=Synechococcus sp. SB0676_bin_10 TaxID=2604869 RepID=A0A6B1F6D7_9SYNE|nr:diaminopimelate decarboxylase [Synechococcus sp. SB0667_bin_8]MYF36318.1 diaminopimelate decarboxylase [Synechococcus sp. SB0678_bin_12]MYG38319.1 diaminopimelate decarboxylase [Synechococcus sp. SB0676_bin_10]MYG64059.1 diaminopimelate decarboxylase [Synechococcus sp. SB0675_bin_7]MYI71472.1 diaminopimelate decarboxylase [Synechococcus sp. SB0673_bin_10]MYI88384.1 diaminopimelate decarboxylase [Synechococcus sp. SB0672_bin_10]